LEVESTSDVGSTGFGLVPAAPGRPTQTVGDGVFAVANEIEEPADFGEGQRDQAPMDGRHGVRFGLLVGWIIVLV
jgi:hypothetical protein